jgi:hypothetical protein
MRMPERDGRDLAEPGYAGPRGPAIRSEVTMQPRPWRRAIAPGTHPGGSIWPWQYGCYFVLTDFSVDDMGVRTFGKPSDVEWI